MLTLRKKRAADDAVTSSKAQEQPREFGTVLIAFINHLH